MSIYRLFLAALLSLAGTACSAESPDQLRPAATLADYREQSRQLLQLDRQHFIAELRRAGLEKPLPAAYAERFGFDPKQPVDFYRTEAGRRIADNVLSYQTPSGGWSKRTDMGAAPRRPGQVYGVSKNYIPTFDNGATSTQFWVMAKAFAATKDKRYADAAERALHLILLAQYPHGGWPQSFPLRGEYHDLITFNDEVISDLLRIVNAVARGDEGLEFLPGPLRQRAADGLSRALQMLVDTQVQSGGRATIWGAQHDPQTLAPAAARAFEPAALATRESADLVLFLMELEQPSENVARVIVSAHDWFQKNQIRGYRWEKAGEEYRELLPDENAGPLWARFYEVGSDRPVFGDRDGSVHYDIRELSRERTLGYGWYTEHPHKVLKKFAAWRQRHLPAPAI
ncbi:pectate lyase [Microbulbifer magnicolonia]|uniref:pectate lyase n=1 Tax=Microbulbifer magnicolonia TaxID=3109744 RepID=UPI002B402774|nr:pectate lyase [Microbulbifer sp. GG15]